MDSAQLIAAPNVNWESVQSQLLLSPRLSDEQRDYFSRLGAQIPSWPGHIWLASSGSRSSPRLVGLSKNAFRVAAESVNRFLGANSQSSWLCALPTFHVGGLSIFARAYFSGAAVFLLEEWRAESFATLCRDKGVSFASLVPTQVFDLVEENIRAPGSFRALLVGGDTLAPHLLARLIDLGWRPRLCYGMTETCAFFAASETNPGESPEMRVLDHVELRVSEALDLELRSEALFSGDLREVDGQVVLRTQEPGAFFKTQDRAELRTEAGLLSLRLLGRDADFIKIGAELVSLPHLRAELAKLSSKATWVVLPDPRLGQVLHLATEKGESAAALLAALAPQLRPFERPRSHSEHDSFPRTVLGKVAETELLRLIQRNNKNMSLG